jgi:hypothetical protein
MSAGRDSLDVVVRDEERGSSASLSYLYHEGTSAVFAGQMLSIEPERRTSVTARIDIPPDLLQLELGSESNVSFELDELSTSFRLEVARVDVRDPYSLYFARIISEFGLFNGVALIDPLPLIIAGGALVLAAGALISNHILSSKESERADREFRDCIEKGKKATKECTIDSGFSLGKVFGFKGKSKYRVTCD